MPFKTKKKKIAASKHGVVLNTSGRVSYIGSEKINLNKADTEPGSKLEFSDLETRTVRLELFKILLLAGLIIGLQLALKLFDMPFLN